ncbi:MAG: calcium-binding protein [Actinomycetota bacterium]
MDRPSSGVMGIRKGFLWGLLAACALVAFVAFAGVDAFAKRMVGTGGADRIAGTAKPDRINARSGNDRVNGRGGGDRLNGAKGRDRVKGGKGRDRVKGGKGKDRLLGGKGKDRLKGGKGADRLKAVDNRRDRAINAGPGKDLCVIDQADLPVLRHCEKAKVRNGPGGGPGPGPGPGPGLRVRNASGLTCGSSLPTCQFEINGDSAESTTGTVSGGGGVGTVGGAAVSTSEDAWIAAGVYGCSANGYLAVTIGSESVRVPITCTV